MSRPASSTQVGQSPPHAIGEQRTFTNGRILTNPPFGGEEEAGIKANFPANMQTAETALLFLQFIMRKLRVAGSGAGRGSRAAVVVPNGMLFGDGVCAVIKEEMLKEFKLHTIVRLPQGVFAPYTDIPANLLFFERGGPTDTVWYYELPLPQGRKKYSKTAPLQFDELAAALAWWGQREEGPQAWRLDFAARREGAVAAAQPHWQRADAERSAALALGKASRELEQDSAAAGIGKKAPLQERQRTLKARQQAHEVAAGSAQAQGDGTYWPIYNLDLRGAGPRGGAMTTAPVVPADYGDIHTGIVELLESARHAAARSVNALMTASYWEFGRRIVEFE